MNDNNDHPHQTSLYTLLWYLSGHGGSDFSATTRRDMIEAVLQDLLDNGLLDDKNHELGTSNLLSIYENHPSHSAIEECMKTMPRSNDPSFDAINAFSWIR